MARKQPIELFMPPNILKAKVGGGLGGPDMAAIKRAEAAMEALKTEFAAWAMDDVRKLVAAREAFANDGLAVSTDEIARRAGVGPGTIYRHFPNKDALFGAVVRNLLEQLRDDAVALALHQEDVGREIELDREHLGAPPLDLRPVLPPMQIVALLGYKAIHPSTEELLAEMGRIYPSPAPQA